MVRLAAIFKLHVKHYIGVNIVDIILGASNGDPVWLGSSQCELAAAIAAAAAAAEAHR